MKKKKSKKKVPVGFRSEFEFDVSQKLQPCGFEYEPNSIPYTVPRKYTPDFVFNRETQTTYVECKGYFRAGDTQKYVAIKNSLGWLEELVFVLMKPDQRVNKQTKLTMSQWCDKHNIKWYTIETLQELIDYVSHPWRNERTLNKDVRP